MPKIEYPQNFKQRCRCKQDFILHPVPLELSTSSSHMFLIVSSWLPNNDRLPKNVEFGSRKSEENNA